MDIFFNFLHSFAKKLTYGDVSSQFVVNRKLMHLRASNVEFRN